MIHSLFDRFLHKKILLLAVPMVLSSITIPLLGLVDTAVIGHLDQAWYLGGVAVGNTMISVILWLCGFLRMATTGMTAQAYGAKDGVRQVNLLFQGLLIALTLGVLLLVLGPLISNIVLNFNSASSEIKLYAEQYFRIRILSTPAALGSLVVLGWLLGRQQVKQAMLVLIITNLVNIILDVLFVVVFLWKVEGVAYASVIADCVGFIVALYFVSINWDQGRWPKFQNIIVGVEKLFQLNVDLFFRSVCLQFVFSFMVFYGAALGDHIAAANAVLISFLMLISYASDGFAYTMETVVGEAIGGKDKVRLWSSLVVITFWAVLIAMILTVLFLFMGRDIIGLISDIKNVQETAMEYMPWLIAFPLVSIWCFLLDGIFVGAVRGREMRNSMIIASVSYFVTWWLIKDYGNHALWAAMLVFMAVRGVVLSLRIKFLGKF